MKVRLAQLRAPRSVFHPMNQETAKVIQTAFQTASYPDIKGEGAMMLLGCIKYGLHTCWGWRGRPWDIHWPQGGGPAELRRRPD